MNILYIFDNNFVPQAAAGICSLLENNRFADSITIYIMSLHVSEDSEKKLENFIGRYADEEHERRAVFIEIDDIPGYFDFKIDTAGWNDIVLARLLLDRFLPEELERIIYLDADTMVRRSLRRLYQTDMGTHPVGMAIEPTCNLRRKKEMGLARRPYHNAGVLLIDLNNWRKSHTGEWIIDYFGKHGGHLFANDQDAINGCLKDEILTISPTYNYHNTYDIYNYRLIKKNTDYSIPSQGEIARIKENPAIVHFLGEERPWRRGNSNRFRKEYKAYLEKTPWKDTPDEEGWKMYFICWRIFNFVMKPFPLTRLFIIDTLMPFMLKRKHAVSKKKK